MQINSNPSSPSFGSAIVDKSQFKPEEQDELEHVIQYINNAHDDKDVFIWKDETGTHINARPARKSAIGKMKTCFQTVCQLIDARFDGRTPSNVQNLGHDPDFRYLRHHVEQACIGALREFNMIR